MAVTPTTLELSWLRPQAEVDQFVVSYVSAGNQRVRLVVPSEADGTVLTDLMPGVEYVVTVTAERGRAVSYPASVRASTGMAAQGSGTGLLPDVVALLREPTRGSQVLLNTLGRVCGSPTAPAGGLVLYQGHWGDRALRHFL